MLNSIWQSIFQRQNDGNEYSSLHCFQIPDPVNAALMDPLWLTDLVYDSHSADVQVDISRIRNRSHPQFPQLCLV